VASIAPCLQEVYGVGYPEISLGLSGK